MKEKNTYKRVELEVVQIKISDVITTSAALDGEGNLSDDLWS